MISRRAGASASQSHSTGAAGRDDINRTAGGQTGPSGRIEDNVEVSPEIDAIVTMIEHHQKELEYWESRLADTRKRGNDET